MPRCRYGWVHKRTNPQPLEALVFPTLKFESDEGDDYEQYLETAETGSVGVYCRLNLSQAWDTDLQFSVEVRRNGNVANTQSVSIQAGQLMSDAFLGAYYPVGEGVDTTWVFSAISEYENVYPTNPAEFFFNYE